MLLVLALAAVASGCRAPGASSLRDTEVRLSLSTQLAGTLARQRHYFATDDEKKGFTRRLLEAARRAEDAPSYYRAVADLLADLEEGHTGLVGSSEVPFALTIPPAAILESAEGLPVVAGVAPGVEGGGLRPGDVLLEVDGVPAAHALAMRELVTAASTPHARRARAFANLMIGPTDEPARVRVRGVDGAERDCYPLRFLLDDEGVNRARFGFLSTDVVAARLDLATAYLALPDFRAERRRQVERALAALGSMPRLVLDLRGNPGGRIRTLQQIAGLFFAEPIDLLRLADDARSETIRSLPGGTTYHGDVLVLVDERTGSAGELLAAALRDRDRALVLGRPTAGSARSRLSAVLPGDVVFHYAGTTEFRRLDGRRVEAVGVEPDVSFRPTRGQLARGGYGDPFADPLVKLALGTNAR